MSGAHPLTTFEQNLSMVYPHCNGFLPGGESFVLTQYTGDEAVLHLHALESGERRELCRFARVAQTERTLWADVALDVARLAVIADNAVWTIDLASADARPRCVYRPPPLHLMHPIPGIRRDGKKIVAALYGPVINRAVEIDAETGTSETLLEVDWWLDHLHYCPFDAGWVGISHEGSCDVTLDRVWGWHRQDAPAGKRFFDQTPRGAGSEFYVGHERWSHHDRSVMIVAYGHSPGTPRGIYEAFTDGRPPRLVSEGDRDLHLDVSRDGRWVAVDTTGPHDLPGKGWENAENRSDILVLDRQSGERRFVAHSTVRQHPGHPHPAFSPDGDRVFFNEVDLETDRTRVWCAPNPFV